MIPNQFEIAHVTITFTSPMIVATGASTDFTDAVCMQDPNGVPTIPGTSIAGVLRHAFANTQGDDKKAEDEVFGYAKDAKNGARSLLTVSWGHAHDATDRPVSHNAQNGTVPNDVVLQAMRSGVFRDHVRINSDSGTAEKSGKFDETLVPRGSRFTFVLMLDKRANRHGVSLSTLIDLLNRPDVFFGGKSRRGFGAFEVTRVQQSTFDLTEASDFARFAGYSFDVAAPCDFDDVSTLLSSQQSATYALTLTPRDYLLPGGGVGIEGVFEGLAERIEHANLFPVYEAGIVWSNGRGTVTKPRFYMPATSIKGTLRHRTLFYLHVLCEEWIGHSAESSQADDIINCLFGTETEEGLPGLVYISEPIFAADTTCRVMQHVSLDRFTQGPMQSALFGEVLLELADQPFRVDVHVDWERLSNRDLEDEDVRRARRALELAMQDLLNGRLALGAAGSRGHGMMQGTIQGTLLTNGEAQ